MKKKTNSFEPSLRRQVQLRPSSYFLGLAWTVCPLHLKSQQLAAWPVLFPNTCKSSSGALGCDGTCDRVISFAPAVQALLKH